MRRRKIIQLAIAGAGTGLIAGCADTTDVDDEPADDPENGEAENGEETENGDEETDNGEDPEEESDEEVDPEEALEDDEVESTREGLEILEHEFYEEEFSAGVEGVVANNTGEELGYVEVGVVFYNDEGQRIGDSFTNTTDLQNGEEWLFDIPLLGGDAEDVAEYNIVVTDSVF